MLRAPVSEMTYTVSSATLNPSIPYHSNSLWNPQRQGQNKDLEIILLRATKAVMTVQQLPRTIFRLDALALSVIAMGTWLAGWLAGWVSVTAGTVSKRLNLS